MTSDPIFICIDKQAGHFKAWLGSMAASPSGDAVFVSKWGAIGTPVSDMQSSAHPVDLSRGHAFRNKKEEKKRGKGYVPIPEAIYREFFPDGYDKGTGNERRALFTRYMTELGAFGAIGLDDHEYFSTLDGMVGERGENCRAILSQLNGGGPSRPAAVAASLPVAPPPSLHRRLVAGFPGNEVDEAIQAARALGVRDLVLGWAEGNGAWIGVPGGGGRIVVASWHRGGMPGEVDDLLDVGEVADALGRLPAPGRGCVTVEVTEESISMGIRMERSPDRFIVKDCEEAMTP